MTTTAASSSLSRSAQCGCKVMAAALRIMSQETDGSASTALLHNRIPALAQLTQWEQEAVNGSPRWWTFLSFYSTCYAVAGLISKQRGTWYITDDGTSSVVEGQPPEHTFAHALQVYKASREAGDTPSSPNHTASPLAVTPAVSELIYEDLKQRADDGIRKVIASRSPYEFQEMVAALLRAMGYFIPFIAPRGKDGGIDVLAFHDVLGASSPRVKVQVKHTPAAAVTVQVVRQLIALLNRDGDAGLVVTSGTFTSEARREARQSHRGMRLIDGDEFVDLWIAYYDKLTEHAKQWLRLTPVYVVSH